MSVTRFVDEFRDAFMRDVSHEELVEIVLRHKSLGISQESTYASLEQLWTELCRDNKETSICSNLEAIMERVWGYCSQSRRIWDSSLSEKSKVTP